MGDSSVTFVAFCTVVSSMWKIMQKNTTFACYIYWCNCCQLHMTNWLMIEEKPLIQHLAVVIIGDGCARVCFDERNTNLIEFDDVFYFLHHFQDEQYLWANMRCRRHHLCTRVHLCPCYTCINFAFQFSTYLVFAMWRILLLNQFHACFQIKSPHTFWNNKINQIEHSNESLPFKQLLYS